MFHAPWPVVVLGNSGNSLLGVRLVCVRLSGGLESLRVPWGVRSTEGVPSPPADYRGSLFPMHRPPLIRYAEPPCPICRKATRRESGRLRCPRCGCSWASDGSSPVWDDPDAQPCPSVWTGITPALVCVLPSGHKRVHRSLEPRHWWWSRDGFHSAGSVGA